VEEDARRRTLEKLRRDRYAKLLGIELLDVKPGYSLLSMVLGEDMLSFHDQPHGGAIFSLADAALGAASNSHGTKCVGLSMEIIYLRTPPSGTRLTAEATEEHKGQRTALYHIAVSGEDGDLVASCHGVVYRKKESFLDDQARPS
jgi:acyl-CoA thioesterase